MDAIDFGGRSDRPSSVSPIRVIGVTLGLTGAGALLGGLSGALALAAAMSLRQDWAWISHVDFLAIAGCFGAIVGGVFAPLTSWVFLRRVPLGKAMLRTTIAAALGGAVTGAMLLEHIALPVYGALLGFLVEAARLYVSAPQRRAVRGFSGSGKPERYTDRRPPDA